MPYKFGNNLGKLTMNVSKIIGRSLENNFKKEGIIFKAIEWVVLTYLYNLGPQTQKQLVESTGKDKSSIKRIIDVFEEQKYASRKIEDHDRRFRKVKLTPKGKSLYLKLEKIVQDTLLTTTKDIDAEKLKICVEVLSSITQNQQGIGESDPSKGAK